MEKTKAKVPGNVYASPKWSIREILDGILAQLKNGCNWCDLPNDLPPYSTVFWHYKQWRTEGVIEEIRNVLHGQVRSSVKKKKAQWTTLIIIDSLFCQEYL